MTKTHARLLILAALAVAFAGCAGRQAAPETAHWQLRFANQPDQKPEWTQSGYLPAWRLDWADRRRPVVRWYDAEHGEYRGRLFFARPVDIPSEPPESLAVSLSFQTHCDMDEPPYRRSGELDVFVMTDAAWRSLADQPAMAEPLDVRKMPGLLLFSRVKGQGDDVHEWTPIERCYCIRRSLKPHQRVWLGVAWSAYHFHCHEWGALRDIEFEMITPEQMEERFWDSIDLTKPGLEEVAKALASGDRGAATAALAGYYRSRQTPVLPAPVGAGSERVVKAAEDVMAHTYRLVGCPTYTFPGPIVWNADPFNYEQWAISLNRHGHWKTLASAYLATGDERYAREWHVQLNSWIDAMPVHIGRHWIQGPYNQGGKSPLSLDAGIRMGQSWFQSFDVFRRSPEVSDETIVRFVRSCRDHAIYLMREENYKRGSNWGAMESNGLYHVGTMLGEFRDAALWCSTAVERAMHELDDQVYPDGAQQELTPGYHGVSLRNFLDVLKLARANDQELPPAYVSRLERMFDYYLKIAMPDMRTPALNDSGRQGIAGWFRDAVSLFPERADFRWALSGGKEGSPPDYTSVAMPYAGWVMMRTGWGPDASYLLFDAGPFGTGHQHEDKLAVILYAHGHELIADPGNYAYDESEWRKYVLSTRAHSTVRVDGKDQNCRSDRSEYRASAPDEHGFRAGEHFVYARDSHTAGYGNPPDRSVVHRRRVLFVKPHYWLVADDLAASDEREHDADVQFVVNASGGDLDAGTLRFDSSPEGKSGARISIVPVCSDGLTARIVKGQTEPEVMGFMPEGFEKLRPVPTVVYTRRFVKSATVIALLAPYSAESPCPVAAVQASASSNGKIEAEIVTAGGEKHALRITPTTISLTTPAGSFRAEEQTFLSAR